MAACLPLLVKILTMERVRYLRNLVERTYLQDVIQRNSIRHDESVLFSLLQVLASTAGFATNPTRIVNTFKSERKCYRLV